MGLLDYLDTSRQQLARIPAELPGLLGDWLTTGARAGAEDFESATSGYYPDGTPMPQTMRAVTLLGNATGGVVPAAGRSVVLGAGPVIRSPPKLGGRAAKAAEKPAPVVRRDLFDYSRLDQVPDVPQVPMARNVPARGPSERVQALDDKKVVKRFNETVARGAKEGIPWYNTDPLRKAFVDTLGEAEGQRRYALYMDMVAATSPRSNVGTNARNASYYYQQALEGKQPVTPLPQPYGHVAQNLHVQNFDNIMKAGGTMGPEGSFPVLQNPKPPSFSQNLQGNQLPVTADTHYVRNWGVSSQSPDWLLPSFKADKDAPTVRPREMVTSGQVKMTDAPAVWWDGMPKPNEYPMLEKLGQREAARMGMTPAQYQASAWVGAGEDTGLASGADPFLRHFENRIHLTADKLGIPPTEVLDQFIKGRITLLSPPTTAPAGLLAPQDDEPAGPPARPPSIAQFRDVL